jgi:SAM-dependent methyltransferase
MPRGGRDNGFVFACNVLQVEPVERVRERGGPVRRPGLEARMSAEHVFLHVGCGPAHKQDTTRAFAGPDWRELRLDIDPNVAPDIVGTMTDMAEVPSESVDAVFSSHNIEHLYAHEVLVALGEFARVLRPSGFLVITCPDLQSVAALIAQDRLMEAAFISPAGPIAPIDIVYGHRPQIAAGNHFMAHRCGFTRRVLDVALRAAGFNSVVSAARAAPYFDLWTVAMKREGAEAELRALAQAHFP